MLKTTVKIARLKVDNQLRGRTSNCKRNTVILFYQRCTLPEFCEWSYKGKRFS